MPALLEAPPRTKRPAPRTAWNKEQAASARLKSLEVRRNNAVKRKATAQQAATILKSICEAEPITDVERALSLAAKHGKAKAVESLASALAKLKRAGVGRAEQPSGNYTPSNGIAPRQPTPGTPQVTQAVAAQPCEPGVNFAQCREPLVGPGKESPLRGPVVAPLPATPRVDGPAHAVIEAITRRLKTMTLEELQEVEREICTGPSAVKTVVGVEPVKPVSGVQTEPGMEKFLVGGVWVWGKRSR